MPLYDIIQSNPRWHVVWCSLNKAERIIIPLCPLLFTTHILHQESVPQQRTEALGGPGDGVVTQPTLTRLTDEGGGGCHGRWGIYSSNAKDLRWLWRSLERKNIIRAKNIDRRTKNITDNYDVSWRGSDGVVGTADILPEVLAGHVVQEQEPRVLSLDQLDTWHPPGHVSVLPGPGHVSPGLCRHVTREVESLAQTRVDNTGLCPQHRRVWTIKIWKCEWQVRFELSLTGDANFNLVHSLLSHTVLRLTPWTWQWPWPWWLTAWPTDL